MTNTSNTQLNFTGTPDTVVWPETHYVYVEKTGPIKINAPKAWQELHQVLPKLLDQNQIAGFMSFYRVEPPVYRAGVSVTQKPEHLPAGVQYQRARGGKYARFTLVGPYSHLPEASGRAFQIAHSSKLALRDGYNIENYVNNPRTTPEDQLITEILFPID